MLQVLKIGHVEFEVQDLPKMAAYYTEVIGLTETARGAGVIYLSTVVDHHTVVLRQGSGQTRIAKIAFQVAPAPARDLIGHLAAHGLKGDARTDSQPGIGEVVRTQNPDDVAIEFYADFTPAPHPYSFRGINPLKLSHVATLCTDIEKTRAYYTDVLGFRFSDSVEDYFYFLRCGCDHHTINLLSGTYAGLQHYAFELTDAAHFAASSDILSRHGVDLLWGPVRHGAGHNLATYHLDPEGQIIELCAELDRMSSEALGYFDPRPYHEDRPQRPKRWNGMAAGKGVWSQSPPPERFNVGIAPMGGSMLGKS